MHDSFNCDEKLVSSDTYSIFFKLAKNMCNSVALTLFLLSNLVQCPMCLSNAKHQNLLIADGCRYRLLVLHVKKVNSKKYGIKVRRVILLFKLNMFYKPLSKALDGKARRKILVVKWFSTYKSHGKSYNIGG